MLPTVGHGPERRNTTSLGGPVQDKGASGRRGTPAGSSGGLSCCDLRTPLGPPAMAPAPAPSTDEGRTLLSDGRSWAQAHTDSLLVSSGDIKSLLAYAVAVLQPQRMKFLTNTWRVQGQGLLGCREGRAGQGRDGARAPPRGHRRHRACNRPCPLRSRSPGGKRKPLNRRPPDTETWRPSSGESFAKVSSPGVRRTVLSEGRARPRGFEHESLSHGEPPAQAFFSSRLFNP